jgi:hypothetical protein
VNDLATQQAQLDALKADARIKRYLAVGVLTSAVGCGLLISLAGLWQLLALPLLSVSGVAFMLTGYWVAEFKRYEDTVLHIERHE